MTLDTKEECLKDLKENYTNPKSSISFSGLSKIYDHYKGVLKLSEIEDFLSSIFSYGYHREPKRLKLKNPIYLYFRRQQLQCKMYYKYSRVFEWSLILLENYYFCR